MIKKLLLVAFFCHQTQAFQADLRHNKTTLLGSIQFPKTILEVPQIRVYAEGTAIDDCISDNTTKKVSFSLNTDKYRSIFYLLVTPKPGQKAKEAQPELGLVTQNTIDYLKVPQGQRYKLYKLELTTTLTGSRDFDLSGFDNHANLFKKPVAQNAPELAYNWTIQETKLASTGRLPDDTIIICFNPDYVEGLKINTDRDQHSFELPLVVIKENIVQLAGSLENLKFESDILIISALDSATFHAKPKQEFKTDSAKPKHIVRITT
jgi:hypothetical protein